MGAPDDRQGVVGTGGWRRQQLLPFPGALREAPWIWYLTAAAGRALGLRLQSLRPL